MITFIMSLFLPLILLYISYLVYHSNSHWIKKGVKQGKPLPLIGDNLNTLLRRQSFCDFVKYVYNMVPEVRYSGMYLFNIPTLVIKDPELIKMVTVKDFDHFTDHRTLFAPESDPLWAKNLLALKGNVWREMRATLSPSFTSSKMRSMFKLILESSEKFIEHFKLNHSEIIEIELKDTFKRFTNDVIASTAFGVEVNSLTNRDNEFYLMGKEATNFSGFWKTLKILGYMIAPFLYKPFKITLLGRRTNEFFVNLVKETIKERKEQNIVRPDMLNLLMEAQVEDFDIAAQALVFFFGGFDSVSSLMCFSSYELACNPEVQARLREEIKQLKEITYENLSTMKYLDMVVQETLRKWPTNVAIDRVCTKDYEIKDQHPEEVPLKIKTGDVIWVPIFGLHHDPKYFPNPDQFDPERFNEDNKALINPYVYLPFGSGPRNCIGSRFALLETKAVLVQILRHFEIVLVSQKPIPISKSAFTLVVESSFKLGLKRL